MTSLPKNEFRRWMVMANGELALVAGEVGRGGQPLHAVVGYIEDRDWWYSVVTRGDGEPIMDVSEFATAAEAARAAERIIADWALHTDPVHVIALLAGTQEEIYSRTGISQSVISDWRSNSDKGMATSTRHLILALIGCTWQLLPTGEMGWAFA